MENIEETITKVVNDTQLILMKNVISWLKEYPTEYVIEVLEEEITKLETGESSADVKVTTK